MISEENDRLCALQRKKIIVVGDIILDRYKIGEVNRISPEAPIPVFREQKIKERLGGAGNVALNLCACEQDVVLFSVVGADEAGKTVKHLLETGRIESHLIVDALRKTTVKQRYCTSEGAQLFRADIEDDCFIDPQIEKRLSAAVSKALHLCDLVVLSDYAKGVLSEKVISEIIRKAHKCGKKVIVDPKKAPFDKYRDCDIIKPNTNEFLQMTGRSSVNETSIADDCSSLCKQYNFGGIVLTRGKDGMFYFQNEGGLGSISAGEVEVKDVSGAGDTALAYLSAAIASDICLEEAAKIANRASALKVAKKGAVAVSKFELEHLNNKIVLPKDIQKLKQCLEGKQVVFTNGCFDLLHVGHIHSLQTAADMGDVLVVGVNTDPSVRKLKGKGRPIICLERRLEMLSALECVDYIIPFDADTPIDIIAALIPDVLVKGNDYKNKEVVGADVVKSNGGRVELISLVDGVSTTEMIDRIRQDPND